MFGSRAEVVEHMLVYGLDLAAGLHDRGADWNAVDHRPRLKLAHPERILRALAVIDVDVGEVPACNRAVRTACWSSTHLKPAVDSVMPTESLLGFALFSSYH